MLVVSAALALSAVIVPPVLAAPLPFVSEPLSEVEPELAAQPAANSSRARASTARTAVVARLSLMTSLPVLECMRSLPERRDLDRGGVRQRS
jgi:hypothetical protein